MICPRCGSAMRLAMKGAYQCPECWDKAEPVLADPGTHAAGDAANAGSLGVVGFEHAMTQAQARRRQQGEPAKGTTLILARLEERLARLEGAVATLRRRLDADPKSGILPEGAAHAAAYRLDDTRASFGSLICPPAADEKRFLGSDPENEEPRRGEPGERR